MSITSANKTVSTDCIGCDGTFSITLALTAQPELIDNPTDMVLILDRSRSMTGTPLASLKEGANTFIDLIAQTTGGTATARSAAAAGIGVVSFGTTAHPGHPAHHLGGRHETAVNGLQAGGSTNHTDAFTKALLYSRRGTSQRQGDESSSPTARPPSAATPPPSSRRRKTRG